MRGIPLRSWRGLAWCFSILLMVVIALWWSQIERIHADGTERVLAHIGLWAGMMGAVFFFPALRGRRALWLILGAAVMVRLLFWSAPVSDDVNRYLWEGQLLLKGENPYAMVAEDPRWESYRDEYWADMNHKNRLTAYPPGMQLVMTAAGWFWYDLQVFKVVALIGDFWVLGMLVLLLKQYHRPLRYLGFYAFNPVVLASFAAEAHLDSLMVGAVLTALLLFKKERWGWAWFWFGVAVQMKLIVLVLLPYLLVCGHWKKAAPFFLVLVVPSLPFFGHLMQGVEGVVGFGSDGAFNAGFFETLRWLGFSDGVSRLTGTFVFVAVGLYFGLRTILGKERDFVRLAMIILGTLVVCSPVAHFWYFTWVIPLIALRPRLSWLVLSLTTSVYFFAWEKYGAGGYWGYPREWVVLAWLPFFAVLIWELKSAFRKRLDFSEGSSMDLVVPVYQAEAGLEKFLKKLKKATPEASQIIVVDGGSDDRTVEIARTAGCRVLVSEKGRGNQIAAGVAKSTADFVAIVHADTVPLEGWVDRLRVASQAYPQAPAFALGQRFDQSSPALLMIEGLNEARALLGGSVFGDQTLVMRNKALDEIGGFPKQPLMEDVEVSWRLMELGPIVYLGQEWLVSAQKWETRFGPRFFKVIGLMLRYRWVRRLGKEAAAEFSKKLYREYYS